MIKNLLNFFRPRMDSISHGEKFISGTLAFFALFFVALITFYVFDKQSAPYMAMSVGAAAVLIFAVPGSTLSQPWSVLGGHLVSAVMGVGCYMLISYEPLAAASSVSLAIIAMFFLRCLHPPGGAAALGAVLGGPQIHDLGFWYVIAPVGVNALLIIVFAIALNRLLPNRHYPSLDTQKKLSLSSVAAEWALGPPRFTDKDLHKALHDMDSYIDISEEDLVKIYTLAVMNANKRRLGEVRCIDIMTSNPIRLRFDDELEPAWQILRNKKLKAAPVVDAFDRPIGIITITDFVNLAVDQLGTSLQEKFSNFLKRSPGHNSDKPETVGQIMSSPVTTTPLDTHIVDLVRVFSEKGFHHMPIIDDQGKVAGMITRTDVMRSLVLTRY